MPVALHHKRCKLILKSFDEPFGLLPAWDGEPIQVGKVKVKRVEYLRFYFTLEL